MRDEAQVADAVAQTAEKFGGVDIVVNNASAINLAPMADLEVKRFDLMQSINSRGTFVLTRAALPHLRESDHAHVLTLSPPLSADPKWLKGNSAYTLSKMGMTMLTLGLAQDEAENGVGANCLWPRTIIATAAVQNLLGGDEAMARSRTPEIYADAAYAILKRDPRECTGNAYIDDEVLAEDGITDLSKYSAPDAELVLDLFVDGWPEGQTPHETLTSLAFCVGSDPSGAFAGQECRRDERHARAVDEVCVGRCVQHHRVRSVARAEATEVVSPQRASAAGGRSE